MAGELERLLIRLEADTSLLRRAFEQADKIVGQKVDSMERQLARANSRLTAGMAQFGKVALQNNIANQRLISGMSQTAVAVQRVGEQSDRAGVSVGFLGKAFAGAFVANRVMHYTTALARQADTYTLINNRLSVVTRSAEEYDYVQTRLMQSAQDSRVGLTDMYELYARMGFALKDTTASTNELVRFTELLAKATIVSGATTSEAEGALRQLSQGMAATELRGQELISVMEQMPYLADMIAKQMGVAVGDLKKLGEQGKITKDIIFAAVFAGADELEEKFDKTTSTMAQGWTQVNNAMLEFIGLANSSSGAGESIAGGFKAMADAINEANQRWKEGSSWWEWLKAWKGGDGETLRGGSAFDYLMGNNVKETQALRGSVFDSSVPSDFDPDAPNTPRTVAGMPQNDPWNTTVIPVSAAQQARELKQAWDELRESQLLALDDLVGDKTSTAATKMEALTAAVRGGTIGWRDYADMTADVQRQTERANEAMLSSTSNFLDTMFQDNKTAATASALINTYQGITKALSSYPPPFSYAMAAMQGAMGFAQVRAIQSTSKNSTGAGGGGAAPAASAPAAAEAGGGAGPSVDRALTVRMSSVGDLIGRRGLRELLENIADMQKDGYRLVVA